METGRPVIEILDDSDVESPASSDNREDASELCDMVGGSRPACSCSSSESGESDQSACSCDDSCSCSEAGDGAGMPARGEIGSASQLSRYRGGCAAGDASPRVPSSYMEAARQRRRLSGGSFPSEYGTSKRRRIDPGAPRRVNARGRAVAAYMKEHGVSLPEASHALKGASGGGLLLY